MDTRAKILRSPASLKGETLSVVTGYFDVLRAEHVTELAEVRSRTAGAHLVVVISQGPQPLLPLRARAELVAALRVVDYVLTADDGDVDALLEALKPAQLVRLEAEDARRVSRLKEHVHKRQG
jgi:bifunctional ADP-heptose synthase (sugar kinase/adenylyltransferase)